ncbi:VOC family protein [Zavarzinella formosa]|uniref:VOC family protein n=1 Tax=Zavarzinella formosa TaxID=360055 RepID=UPI0012F8C0E4|nr:VOC family protein [Zavarzinella formosa]
MPKVPEGNGEHPVSLVVISANNLAASGEFYSRLFGWQLQPMSASLTGVVAPAGPIGALRSNIPDGFPAMVPYVRVSDVEAMLDRVVTAGGTIEQAPWSLPGVGKLARFKDPSGTIYGLTDAVSPGGLPRIPMPVGPNPKPPAGAICHLEMHAADGAAAARFFGELFGWGTLPTMPQYMAFDTGAGVAGIFQSHTPTTPALAYVYTTDVDAKLAEIEAAGGKRTGGPMRMPGFGCFGYFKDPSDTSMGLIGP